MKDVKIYIEQRISKKSGNPYEVLIIELSNGYKHMVFLNEAELFMFKSFVGA